ncbi:MAG: hypothetical protein ACREX0_10495 [Noviherbaspirillum sp.]
MIRVRATAMMKDHPLWAATLLVIYAAVCAYLLFSVFAEHGVPFLFWRFG